MSQAPIEYDQTVADYIDRVVGEVAAERKLWKANVYRPSKRKEDLPARRARGEVARRLREELQAMWVTKEFGGGGRGQGRYILRVGADDGADGWRRLTVPILAALVGVDHGALYHDGTVKRREGTAKNSGNQFRGCE